MNDRARKNKVRAYMAAHPGTSYTRAARAVDAEHSAARGNSEVQAQDNRLTNVLNWYGEAIRTALLLYGQRVSIRVGGDGDHWWLAVDGVEGVEELGWDSDSGWSVAIATADGRTDSLGRRYRRRHIPDETGRLLLPVSSIVRRLACLITGTAPWPVL
jgi:hypothetical protein